MMHRIYHNIMARPPPFEVRIYVLTLSGLCMSWRTIEISPLTMTSVSTTVWAQGGAHAYPDRRVPNAFPLYQRLLGSNLLAINYTYLVALLLMSLIDAIIPEAMAELAIPRASGCALARW